MNESCIAKTEADSPFWAILLQVSQRVETRLEAALAESGLTLAKIGVLNHLVKAGESLPLSRLAERSSCVKSNMTQLVDRLEADGLVKRADHPEDRRAVLAAITEEGLRRYEAGGRALAALERELLEDFTDEERAVFTEYLRRFGEASS
ncbi:MAG: MarR family transcriptional regulator [Pyrinomonadaceae bacterium]